MAEKKKNMIAFRFGRVVCRIFCGLFLRISVYGKENVPKDGAFIIAGNHQCYFDPVFCGIPIKRDLFFLARDSLFKNRLFGFIIASVNSIPVKRDHADIKSMKTIISILKQGYGVCLFPESTRTTDGRIKDFKPGLGLLSRKGNAGVLPVLIDGAFECWPKNKKFFRFRSKISIVYGKYIPPDELKNIKDKELAETLTATLRNMQNNLRTKQAKAPIEY